MEAINDYLSDLNTLQSDAVEAFSAAENADDVKILRRRFLGRRGLLRDTLKKLRDLPEEDRPKAGKRLNEVIKAIQDGYSQAKVRLPND